MGNDAGVDWVLAVKERVHDGGIEAPHCWGDQTPVVFRESLMERVAAVGQRPRKTGTVLVLELLSAPLGLLITRRIPQVGLDRRLFAAQPLGDLGGRQPLLSR
jgi:hypothetical protein